MRTFGLIGYPLSHSFSKKYFSEKFKRDNIPDCHYELFPLTEIDQFNSLLSDQPSLCGLNVTIPYKVSVLPYLNELDPPAAEIGAVNCIKINNKNGVKRLKGFNTDAYGFQESLKPLLHKHHQKALIFGDGGAAKAVKYVLGQLNIPFIVVLRNKSQEGILYQEVNAELLEKHTILINTTPVGTYPNLDHCLNIPYQYLSEKHLAYDLIYNPEETLFLKRAKDQGAMIKNGLEMLHLQAEQSWFIWTS